MRSLLAPSLQRAQALYRMLPAALRSRVGVQVTRMTEPTKARLMPEAEPGRGGPANSALLIGLASSSIGHGAALRLCAQDLRARGVPISTIDVSDSTHAPTEPGLGGEPTDAMEAEAAVVFLNPREMVHALGGERGKLLRGRRVAVHWVWELERTPREWRRFAGHVPHEIWAPTRFVADAVAADFQQPVKLVPYPCACAPPAPDPLRREPTRRRLRLAPDDFLVFSSFSVTSSLVRKNPLGALAAFEAAFGDRRDVRLLLRAGNAAAYPEAAAQLAAAVRASRASVTLVEAAGWEDLLDFYGACDAYLSLHRSEGFGLNLAEAMLCERPVVATGWSGNLDFMDAECAALVPPARLTPVRDPQGVYRLRGARWAEPDLDAAVSHLRRLREDVDRRGDLGRRGRLAALRSLSGGEAQKILSTAI